MNYYDLTKSVREQNARRYLAQKQFEREQSKNKFFFRHSSDIVGVVSWSLAPHPP